MAGFRRLSPEALVEEAGTCRTPPWFLCAGIAHVVRVRLTFEDLQHCFNPGLPQLAMHAHGAAQEQITGPAGQDRRRKITQVAVGTGESIGSLRSWPLA